LVEIGQYFSALMKMSLILGQYFSALVQFEQNLLALVLLLPSSVQVVIWATHQWWACSFSYSQPLAWKILWAFALNI
jgi:hypothetical protein